MLRWSLIGLKSLLRSQLVEIGGPAGGGVVGLTELLAHRAAGGKTADPPAFVQTYVTASAVEGYQIGLDDLSRYAPEELPHPLLLA